MIKLENHLGTIEMSQSYFVALIGRAASSCFGVAGMANSNKRQQIRSFIKKAQFFADQGVAVRRDNDLLNIELHIIVTYGLNISAICQSIVNKVKYTVEKSTGLQVGDIKVFVDGMKAES